MSGFASFLTKLNIAGEEVDAEIDTQADEDRHERDGKNVEMPDNRSQKAEGPRGADAEHQQPDERMPDAAESE